MMSRNGAINNTKETMMRTEDQAVLLWCPMVRASESDKDMNACNALITDDNSGRSPDFSRCIASKCMLWRWSDGPEIESFHRRGSCGLASNPPAGRI